MLTLGIDTSNYATSLAVFDTNAGEVVCDCKKFLPVKAGQLGLRQSDALFHHTAALPLKSGQVDKNWPANNELNIDGLTFKIYHTPGHTQGSVVLNCGNLLFSGDTLFAGSCGRTDMPGGSMRQMQESLSLLANLPLGDDTQVLPGHESFSTLWQERRTNPYIDGGWAY